MLPVNPDNLFGVGVVPNYFLCIAWVQDGIMHRYKLWENVDEVIYFNIPLYTGQLIMKNFRLEVWSTNSGQANVSQSEALRLMTSVLGGIDYRYSTDTSLVGNDGENTTFNNVNAPLGTPLTLPLTFPAGSFPTTN